MARPKLQIDPQMVERMAQRGNTIEDMAVILGCSRDTLERRFAAQISKGRALRREWLRDRIWNCAMSGNVTMLIFLAKNDLGMMDRIEEKTDLSVTGDIEWKAQWGNSTEPNE